VLPLHAPPHVTCRRLFSLCEWGNDDVLSWGGDVGQMFRVQMDHLRNTIPPFITEILFSFCRKAFWHFPPKAAGQGLGQGTGDIIEYMAQLQPSNHTRRFAWMDPDFLMTECVAPPPYVSPTFPSTSPRFS
jgi:hypothetical protein